MKSQKLRDSARGQECTFNIPSVCNYNTETTVLCHLPDESGTGTMGGKSDDWCAAFGCSNCHDVIDGKVTSHVWETMTDEFQLWYIHRAMISTWSRWIEMEVIKIA